VAVAVQEKLVVLMAMGRVVTAYQIQLLVRLSLMRAVVAAQIPLQLLMLVRQEELAVAVRVLMRQMALAGQTVWVVVVVGLAIRLHQQRQEMVGLAVTES
jgi:hypothetical protein